jgi:hypothetical protein
VLEHWYIWVVQSLSCTPWCIQIPGFSGPWSHLGIIKHCLFQCWCHYCYSAPRGCAGWGMGRREWRLACHIPSAKNGWWITDGEDGGAEQCNCTERIMLKSICPFLSWLDAFTPLTYLLWITIPFNQLCTFCRLQGLITRTMFQTFGDSSVHQDQICR